MRTPSAEKAWDAVDPFDISDKHLWVKIEHLGRYLWALQVAKNYRLHSAIDASSGTGFGSKILAEAKLKVHSVDIDAAVFTRYKANYGNPRIKKHVVDIENGINLKSIGAKVDMVVSFETLEHLANPINALKSFSKLLKVRGVLLISVPNHAFEPISKNTGIAKNTLHKQFFSFGRLVAMLQETGFSVRTRLGQGVCNRLYKREAYLRDEIHSSKSINSFVDDISKKHILTMAQLFGMPTVDDVDYSYSHIVMCIKEK